MRAQFIYENLDFERGINPKVALGIGQIANIPKILLKQDLKSGYGVSGLSGTIRDIQTTKNRILMRFWHGYKIRNLETNKIISKEKYAKKLAEDAGIWNLFQNFYHAHKTSWEFYFTLKDEYKDMLPQNRSYDYDNMNDSFILFNNMNEALDFEREGSPLDKIGIGKKALMQKKAMEIDWDWTPGPHQKEEVLDVIHYPVPEDNGLYIKVSKISDPGGSPTFVAVNNIGEPYHADASFYDTPEEALDREKKFIDEWFEEQREDYS